MNRAECRAATHFHRSSRSQRRAGSAGHPVNRQLCVTVSLCAEFGCGSAFRRSVYRNRDPAGISRAHARPTRPRRRHRRAPERVDDRPVRSAVGCGVRATRSASTARASAVASLRLVQRRQTDPRLGESTIAASSALNSRSASASRPALREAVGQARRGAPDDRVRLERAYPRSPLRNAAIASSQRPRCCAMTPSRKWLM